jgi:hypothetical protein
MFRRIELINTYPMRDGTVESYKHGLMGISLTPVVEAWIYKLRGSDRSLPRNARFWFTEAGWRDVGKAVVAACIKAGQDYRVIRIKENEVEVVWRDAHTGYEVAAQPKKARAGKLGHE